MPTSSSHDLQGTLAVLRASVTDGRAQNVRYRQNEMHKLYKSLKQHVDKVCDFIRKDVSCSALEARTEIYLAFDVIQQLYKKLDFEGSIKEEYLVKAKRDNHGRRVGLGLVALRPGKHSIFYSIVAPLAASIAAGNCFLLELSNTESSVANLLHEILTGALDPGSFSITATELQTDDLPQLDHFIDQSADALSNQSSSISPALAIVDRSADLKVAAKAITASRLGQNSSSPYSPSVAIVNDFTSADFRIACFQQARSVNTNEKVPAMSGRVQSAIDKAEKMGAAKVYHDIHTPLLIIEVQDIASTLLQHDLNAAVVFLVPSKSVIDTVNMTRSSPTLLASYIFANLATAKFLAEQIPSHASYIDQIPAQLLVGPYAYPHSLHPRYSPDDLSVARPQFVTPQPPLPQSLTGLREAAARDLRPTGQKLGYALGFFEQGIFIGLGFYGLLVLPALSYCTWTMAKHAYVMATRG